MPQRRPYCCQEIAGFVATASDVFVQPRPIVPLPEPNTLPNVSIWTLFRVAVAVLHELLNLSGNVSYDVGPQQSQLVIMYASAEHLIVAGFVQPHAEHVAAAACTPDVPA